MKDFKSVKKLALYTAATVICVAGQSAFAHTGIRDVVLENTSVYNALTVTHGCNGNVSLGAHQNVIAVSAVFPNAADPAMSVVTKLDPVTGASMGTLPDLSGDIAGVISGVGFTNLGLGLVQPNLFPNFIPTIDPNTLVGAHATPLNRGFVVHNGPKPYASAPLWQQVTSTTGLAPFKVGPVAFNPTSCAISLKVRVAVANWCKGDKKSYKDDDRVDLWIGHTTAKFNDPLTMPYDPTAVAAGSVYWPTMTIARDLVNNPLAPSCGAGYNLAIEPADADIDTYLPIPFGDAPSAAPRLFWPTTAKK